MHCVYSFPLTFAEPAGFSWPNKSVLGMSSLDCEVVFGAFSVCPFKNSLGHFLVLKIRKDMKEDSGTVFVLTFPVCVMDFLVGDTSQLRQVALTGWSPTCENCSQAS